MPKIIFQLGLNANEIAILAYLMYLENRKTYQCHPSYASIGEACGLSVNTVRKYVDSLARKGFIATEPLEEEYYQEQLRIAEHYSAYAKAMKEYEKKYGEIKK